jgi:NADH-quinone oxidoreductase subunit L
MLTWIWLVPTLPLAGFLLLTLGRRFPRWLTAVIGTGSVGLSMALSIAIAVSFAGSPPASDTYTRTLWQWISLGGFSPSIAFTVDGLSVVMILVVTVIGFLIHFYSTRFMAGEEGYSRFFAYMNLFVFSMLVLVLADNLLLLYLGWEGVGLCSYLLIGFWYTDPDNGRAARKAFIVTRVGDLSLAIGLFLIATNLGSLNIQEAARRARELWPLGSAMAVAASALLLGGAVGKSAQLPLHTWLPDAMAGPSPVSALIHAATMVTAGVYLIARNNALFSLAPAVETAVAIVGIAGVLVAGLSALTQRNIKRVLAYSTMSQLGYMFLALGVGSWSGAIFHLMTHAMFKSLLFLAAGVVILAANHEHDIFSMGGMARKMPFIFVTFLIGGLTLAALPPTTAGFSSKDHILMQVWQSGGWGRLFWLLGMIGVFVTSTYTFRMIFIVFLGKQRAAAGQGEHEGHGKPLTRTGAVMGIPLAILSLFCLGAGFLDLPRTLGGTSFVSDFLHTVLPTDLYHEPTLGMEALLQILAEVASLAGIPMAWALYRMSRRSTAPAGITAPAARGPLARFLFGGWGFDWVYDRVLVRPMEALARAKPADGVDAAARGIGGIHMLLSRALRWTQNGRVRWYAAGLAAGAILAIAAAVIL